MSGRTAGTAALAVLVCLIADPAVADGRINVRFDFSRTDVEGAYNNVEVSWPGVEVEFEKEFASPVLSGFSLGLRRESFYGFTGFGTARDVRRWDEGTYLMVRMYRTFALASNRSWSVGPAIAVLYGIPGTTLDRTTEVRTGDAGYDYTHVFPIRNSDPPKLLAAKAELVEHSALLYPEISCVLRRRLAKGGIVLDWIAGIRIVRFGIVDSNTQGDAFADRRTFIPSIGLRVGFRIF